MDRHPKSIKHDDDVPVRLIEALRENRPAPVSEDEIRTMLDEMDPKMLCPDFVEKFSKHAENRGLCFLSEWLEGYESREDICRKAAETGDAKYLPFALECALMLPGEFLADCIEKSKENGHDRVTGLFTDYKNYFGNRRNLRVVEDKLGYPVYTHIPIEESPLWVSLRTMFPYRKPS